jgi:serine/threonine-protein kinase HipA
MLRVWLRGALVGDLRLHVGSRWEFRFDEGYLDLPERPVLGRWFEDQDLRRLAYDATQSYLPAFFQNYLPEVGSWLREQLASRAGVDPKRNGPLLAVLGEDLPGAIVVREVDDASGAHDEAPIVDRRVLHADPLRFSLAGMQPKLSVAKEGSRYTLPVTGMGGRWIAKLPDPHHARVPEHEEAMLSLARRVGICVPEHECIDWRSISGLPSSIQFNESKALLVRRYDRLEDGTRVHQEDFAQVFNRQPYNKYNETEHDGLDATFRGIGKVVAAVCGSDDFVEYVRRLVFMVLIGNHDAHLKNWSLVYPTPLRARLAPAYDLLSTVVYLPEQTRLALGLFKRDHFRDVVRSDFERLAEKARMDVAATLRTVDETVARFREAWGVERTNLPFLDVERDRLEAHFEGLPLARSA